MSLYPLRARRTLTNNLQVMQEPMVSFGGFKYLKIALVLMLFSIVAYLVHEPFGGANGGTWLGYTLGTIAAVLCLWLAWFGIQKRRYGTGRFKMQEWLSAHIYMGLSLIVVATLHTGFQVGWNVHTLAYILLMLVIVSGVIGLYLYIRLPRQMSENRGGMTFDEVLALISELDTNCTNLAIRLGDTINDIVRDAVENTRVGGGFMMQLKGYDPSCPTAEALAQVQSLAGTLDREQAGTGRQLVLYLARKNELLQVARRDVQFRAWLNVWLLAHVPATVALLVTLTIHVVTVFFYW